MHTKPDALVKTEPCDETSGETVPNLPTKIATATKNVV